MNFTIEELRVIQSGMRVAYDEYIKAAALCHVDNQPVLRRQFEDQATEALKVERKITSEIG